MRLAVPAILALILSAAPAAARERPVDATGLQLMTQPRAYNMKLVRLRGRIDQCTRIVCSLCPETATDLVAGCVGIGLGEADEPGEPGDRRTRVADSLRELYRFTTVTLEGRFDAHCLIRTDIVCTDGVTMLREVRILKVWKRQTVNDGLVTGHADPVTPAGQEDAAAMLAAVRPLLAIPDQEEEPPMAAFDWDTDLVDGARFGMVCYCREDSCQGRWPTRRPLGFKSPSNPFDCFDLIKDQGGWRPLY